MTQNTTTVSNVERNEARARLKAVLLVSIASLFGLSVWFSTNAIPSALELDKSLGEDDMAWLTIAVQLGCVFGTVVIALTKLADLLNARRLFMLSAIAAGILNLLIIPLDSLPWSRCGHKTGEVRSAAQDSSLPRLLER
jgi:MFS family permease